MHVNVVTVIYNKPNSICSHSPNPFGTHSLCVCVFQGWGGVGSEVFLSLPCVLGVNGSTRLAGVALRSEDDAKLKASVSSLSNLITQLKI